MARSTRRNSSGAAAAAAPGSKRPAKKSKQAQPAIKEDVVAPSTSSSDGPTIDEVYEQCVVSDVGNVVENANRQRMALWEAQDGGYLQSVVWPALVSQKLSKQQQQKAALVLATLVSFVHRQGHVRADTLDFVGNNVDVWQNTVDVLCQGAQTDLTFLTTVAHFLDVAWLASQSHGVLRAALVPHVTGLPIWHWMPNHVRELQVRKRPHLNWQTCVKPQHEPFVVKAVLRVLDLVEGSQLQLGQHHESPDALDEGCVMEEEVDNTNAVAAESLAGWIFVHRALELLIDLLSDHDSRVVLLPWLETLHFAMRCRLALGTSEVHTTDSENVLLSRTLLDRLQSLLHLPLVEAPVAGGDRTLSDADVIALYHGRGTILQKMCHRHYVKELPGLVFAGVGMLTNGSGFLRESLSAFPDASLSDLLHKMRLVDKNAGGSELYNREFLLLVLEDYLTQPANPLRELQSHALYPTERLLWDMSKIPPSHASLLPASQVMSLPKLQCTFLSYSDYMLRNFELTRLESAYEIRSDLVDAIRRVRPLLRQNMDVDGNDDEETILKTEFSGWSRMAIETSAPVKVTKVANPQLGEHYPARVTAEVVIDLSACGDKLRREWDELGEHDNIFLVAIDASKMSGRPAPLLREYHLEHGQHLRWDTDGDRRIPDVDDRTFPSRFGVTAVRGCMILSVRDGENNKLTDVDAAAAVGTKRIMTVALDPVQFSADRGSSSGTNIYRAMNLVVRRHGRENNFKAVLETIRNLMTDAVSVNQVLPSWLHAIFLGHGDASDASFSSDKMKAYANHTAGVPKPTALLDFGDTFLDEAHLRASFPDMKVDVDGRTESGNAIESGIRSNYKVRFTADSPGKTKIECFSYPMSDHMTGNPVQFTRVQVQAIRSGLSPGLTICVGPPGTGKTDVAVQVLASLFHSFPTQRTVIITHSNAALNDIFQKVMARGDVDERYMIRLGAGERELQSASTHDFTKAGRVAYSLHRRDQLLEEVQLLSESLYIGSKADRSGNGSSPYTCETAAYFRQQHIRKRVTAFADKFVEEVAVDDMVVAESFPFRAYFGLEGQTVSLTQARELIQKVAAVFEELQEYRPLEVLRTQRQRSDYLITKQARIVAMTCTHAAIARSHLLDVGFEYDNVVVEEAGQMTEIEAFIPLLLQNSSEAGSSAARPTRLKRVCMLGDHHQLPPVIKNQTFASYSNLDQSLFARLIRFGVPYIELDKQGRARPEIAALYAWRYSQLGNLDHVVSRESYQLANAGLAHTFQIVNVDDYDGKGETAPTAFFYQNIGEAEYVVALFQYMVLIGYQPASISILTTYNGQKELIQDILAQRCGKGTPLEGIRPLAVSTVDQYQGQQNDYILLSLVRSRAVGHLRDIRRLVVALSRARFGLYVFCRFELFAVCHELKRTFDQAAELPKKLQLVMGETLPCSRKAGDTLPANALFEIEDVAHMGSLVHKMQVEWLASAAEG